MKKTVTTLAALSLATSGVSAEPREITAKGPQGDLTGTLIPAPLNKPTVLIIPGSGPTDRDGNNPMGVTAASYRLLAEALANGGIGSVRIDKRGMFGSRKAVRDANDVTIGAYAEDALSWIASIRAETGAPCVWLLGHSEGGLIALEAAQKATDVCGVMLVASVGRRAGEILREQITSNPANALFMDDALVAIDALEKGERVDVEGKHPAIVTLFNPAVQGFLIDMMARDPAALAGSLKVPTLIVAGGKDLQTPVADGEALAASQPEAKLVVVENMNHVLKAVEGDDRAANFAAYTDPSRPIHPDLVTAIVDFVGG